MKYCGRTIRRLTQQEKRDILKKWLCKKDQSLIDLARMILNCQLRKKK